MDTVDGQSHLGTAPSLRLPYLPALDGLRALALLGVLAFHAGFAWLRGGYLPLTVFFVLSGFLITSLLLLERERTGRIGRRNFWIRRARRLVPGALLGLGAAAAYVAVADPTDLSRLQGDAVSSVLWVTNWRFIATGSSYADVFVDPSPLQHYWSLAIEEQFYLVLPLLAGVLLFGKRRLRAGTQTTRWAFVAVVAALAVASFAIGRVLHAPGDAPLRTYYGTDTRAVELLIGVLLACAMVGRDGLRRLTGPLKMVIDGLGLVALVITVALWGIVDQFDDWLFEGGLTLVALIAAVALLAATQEGTVVSRLLGIPPLAALGRVSYGAYVLHWPLFLWMSPERTGLDPWPLFALRFATLVALASLSYKYIEQPVRHGRLPVFVAPVGWAASAVALVGVFAVVTTTVAAPQITLRAEGEAPPPPPPPPAEVAIAVDPTQQPAGSPAPAQPGTPGTAAPTTAAPGAVNRPRGGPAPAAQPAGTPSPEPTTAPRPGAGPSPTTTTPPTTAPPPPPPKRVLVLGDSLANNLAVGLTRWGEKSGRAVVWDHGLAGCPLSRGGDRRGWGPVPTSCGWWGTSEARSDIDGFRPDVVLVMGGLGDVFDRKLPEWNEYRSPGDPVFDSWLISEYRALAEVARANGVPVVWAVPPCMDPVRWEPRLTREEGEARFRHHNRAYVPAIRVAGQVTLADVDAQLCPNGSFDRDALGIENSRPDGLHLTDHASEVLAQRWLGPVLLDAAR